MPELPEVETIRLGLQKYLVGHKIVSIDARLKKMVIGETRYMIGAKVTGVRRFGKALVIDLDNEYSIAIHVKMTGQLIYQGARVPQVSQVSRAKVGETLPNKFTHVIFHLDSLRHSGNPPAGGVSRIPNNDGDSGQARMTTIRQGDEKQKAYLFYNDIRQFGWINIVKTNDVGELPFFKALGPEPFIDLTYDVFDRIVQNGKKTAIKILLMDQKKISGIGNIYANDALYDAGIDPRRLAASLTETERRKLFVSIEKVLKKGIEVGGSSEWQYVNALGEEGGYQKIFMVYNKKTCQRCGEKITKIKLGGRGTSYCLNCQK